VRLHSIATVPIWENADGSRRPGLEPEDGHPPVVGWCNVADIELAGERYDVVLVYEDERGYRPIDL
jgi:hypothetical protein